MFQRKAYDQLLKWKKECNGSRAILLEGARRVGKTTIAKEFAKNEYKSFIYIDFSVASKNILSIFNDIGNINLFFIRLQSETKIKLYDRESVIIFDEVQLFPIARQAIKYLVNDGRYDYIETGSLISIKKNVKDILIPSEERKIQINPMDYEEFCSAVKSNYEVLNDIYAKNISLGMTNKTLIRDFRIYMAVGGMPQAVEAYVNHKNFNEIDQIKQDIINLYKEDLKKIDSSGRLSNIYESIPSQLASKKNRFSLYRAVKNNKTSKDEERLFDLLDSKIVNVCYRVNEPSLSLTQDCDFSKFKLYLADTGLFVTMLFNSGNKDYENLYNKLISDKMELNLGYLFENVASQLIVASGKKLFYHSWKKTNSTHNYEVDFLLYNQNKISPFEIKSDRIKSHDSIDAFSNKYSRICGQKYIISCKDISKDKDIYIKPFYLFEILLENIK